MADNKRIDSATGTQTVGHEWDGIEELDTPMPRWWLWTFYATILFSIGYVILYPAWPLIHGATPGTTGWTSRGQLDEQVAIRRDDRLSLRKARQTRKALSQNCSKAGVLRLAGLNGLRESIDGFAQHPVVERSCWNQ